MTLINKEQLDANVFAKIKKITDTGNEQFNQKQYGQAVKTYVQALQLVPDPPEHWEATTWILASIGDAYYHQKDYRKALDAFLDSLTCPGGIGNPFIHLRLGEVYLEIGQNDKAKDELARAYIGAGQEIFENEPPQYLKFVQQYMR